MGRIAAASPGQLDAALQADARAWPGLLTRVGRLYPPAFSRTLLETLLGTVEWQTDYRMFGRRFQVPRLQAWYADEGVAYRYANNLLERRDWIAPLQTVCQDVARTTGHAFNAVLVTLYRDGHDHVTWHADDEPELGTQPVIASLSLGATRQLAFKPKQGGAAHELPLADGELLLMRPTFQHHWLHRVPPDPMANGPRINLTFRQVQPPPAHV